MDGLKGLSSKFIFLRMDALKIGWFKGAVLKIFLFVSLKVSVPGIYFSTKFCTQKCIFFKFEDFLS